MRGPVKGGALDTIARGLASGMSRREALRAGGTMLVGAAAMSPADALAVIGLTCPSGRVKCNGVCCPRTQVCLGTGSKRHCGCPAHSTKCGTQCAYLATSHQNCGRCGHACASTQACCAGGCVNLHTSINNCGKCGHACQHGAFVATVACVSGTCGIVSCDANWANCDGSYSTGCETDTTSTQNCGGCGVICQGTNTTNVTCTSGTCVNTCANGYGDCDSDPANGCETNIMTSTQNCGGCGQSCGASADTCSAGNCLCGSGGPCGAQQQCVGGSCVCNASSCSHGCCSGNTCLDGTSNAACGAGGETCHACPGGQICYRAVDSQGQPAGGICM